MNSRTPRFVPTIRIVPIVGSLAVLLAVAGCDNGTGADGRDTAPGSAAVDTMPPAPMPTPEPAQAQADGGATMPGAVASDDAVTAAVKEKLENDPTLGGIQADVNAQDGHVVIRGTVPSDAVRAQVTRSVLEVAGVNSVDNRLEVVG